MVTKREYAIGGLHFLFSGWLPEQNRGDWLPQFLTQSGTPDIEIKVSRADDILFPADCVPEWESAYVRSCRIGNVIHCYFRRDSVPSGSDYAHLFYDADTPQLRNLELCDRGMELTEKHILTCIGSEELFLQFGRAVLHSSCVETDATALLFSGVSGIGKSTQAALWEQYAGAEVKNGDRNLLYCKDGREFACGLPYAGSSGICSSFDLPVRAIVFLGQAKQNEIRRLDTNAAVRCILSQLPIPRWNRDAIGRAMDTAVRIAAAVPIYALNCLPDRTAVELLRETLARK